MLPHAATRDHIWGRARVPSLGGVAGAPQQRGRGAIFPNGGTKDQDCVHRHNVVTSGEGRKGLSMIFQMVMGGVMKLTPLHARGLPKLGNPPQTRIVQPEEDAQATARASHILCNTDQVWGDPP